MSKSEEFKIEDKKLEINKIKQIDKLVHRLSIFAIAVGFVFILLALIIVG